MPHRYTTNLSLNLVRCSIRFYLLSEEEQAAAGLQPAIAAVKLRSRHWHIYDADNKLVDEIQGDGVVGEYPVLRAGAPWIYGFVQIHSYDGQHRCQMQGISEL